MYPKLRAEGLTEARRRLAQAERVPGADWIDTASAERLRDQIRHEREQDMAGQIEVEQACKRVVAALSRLIAACESDADLERLPAVRDFIKAEASEAQAAIESWAKDESWGR